MVFPLTPQPKEVPAVLSSCRGAAMGRCQQLPPAAREVGGGKNIQRKKRFGTQPGRNEGESHGRRKVEYEKERFRKEQDV